MTNRWIWYMFVEVEERERIYEYKDDQEDYWIGAAYKSDNKSHSSTQ